MITWHKPVSQIHDGSFSSFQLKLSPDTYVPQVYYDLSIANVATGQCDCRLSIGEDPAMQRWREVPPLLSDQVYRVDGRIRWQVVEDLQQYVVIYIPSYSGIAVLNTSAFHILNAFKMPMTPRAVSMKSGWPRESLVVIETLYRLGFLVGSEGALSYRPLESREQLTVWLHVTNACSLRCTYCYIAKSNEHMGLKVGYNAIDAVILAARRERYRALQIKYAGGEPTLVADEVIALHEYAARQASQYGIEVEGVVLSNGVGLSPLKVQRLRTANLKLMISIDGLSISHDRQRPTIRGTASSHYVLRGIKIAIDGGLKPDISITVTRDSASSLLELIAWILKYDLIFGINYYHTHGDHVARESYTLSVQSMIDTMRRVIELIKHNVPHRSLLGSLVDRSDLRYPHQRACAVGEDYIVIDHLGRIAGCQMKITDAVGQIGTDDPLEIIRASDIGVHNISVDDKEGCQSCEWRYWCSGGCPLETWRASGRTDVKSPYCAIYQALYPEVIQLEALRLIQYQVSGDSVFRCSRH